MSVTEGVYLEKRGCLQSVVDKKQQGIYSWNMEEIYGELEIPHCR